MGACCSWWAPDALSEYLLTVCVVQQRPMTAGSGGIFKSAAVNVLRAEGRLMSTSEQHLPPLEAMLGLAHGACAGLRCQVSALFHTPGTGFCAGDYTERPKHPKRASGTAEGGDAAASRKPSSLAVQVR